MRKKIIISIILVSFMPLLASSYLVDWFFESDYANNAIRNGIEKLYEHIRIEKEEIINLMSNEFEKEGHIDVEKIKEIDDLNKENMTSIVIQKDGEYVYVSKELEEILKNSDKFKTQGEIENTEDTNYSVYESVYYKDENGLVHISIVVNYDTFDIYMDQYNLYYLNLFIAMFTVLLIVMILWISNHIKKSLHMIENITKEIEMGNLDSGLTYTRKDEFKKIADVIENLKVGLRSSIEERERLESEKKKMLVNITHDIKTPITSIKGYIQAISDGIVKDEDTLDEYLQIISDKSDVIDSMVKDFNQIVKYDYGQMLLSAEYIDINCFVIDCIEEFHYSNKDVKINYNSKIENPILLFDPKLMQRVLSNIISNSIKYNKNSKLIIEILIEESFNQYKIRIADNGVGVSEENLDNIFKRFYREDESRNSEIEGSGIGLSICNDIVSMHDGQISACNSMGKFVVQIELPKK